MLNTLVRRRAPSLLEVYRVGTHTAVILFVAAGDNPHQLYREAAFVHLCGVAPLPASSGSARPRTRSPTHRVGDQRIEIWPGLLRGGDGT